jgi:hypothetical protein
MTAPIQPTADQLTIDPPDTPIEEPEPVLCYACEQLAGDIQWIDGHPYCFHCFYAEQGGGRD